MRKPSEHGLAFLSLQGSPPFYVREVPRREDYQLVSRTLSPQCRRWRKPPLRLVADPSPCQQGEAARGAGLAPGRRRAGPFPPWSSAPFVSLVGPSQPFLRTLNGSVGNAPNRKRTGEQE